MKTLILSVLDRVLLPQLLPQQGGKIEMILCDSIARKIEFSPQEISDFGLKDDNGYVSWNKETIRDVEYEFTPEQIEVLKNASKKTDENRLINRQNLTLIEKIDSL